ncbi:MAG TPA: spore coat U domain-containing protein [Myxococcota bacterium]|nr:spore coat U domain-containing protein [Myxococcota bacterium]
MKMATRTIIGLCLVAAVGHATQIQQNMNATVSVVNGCSIQSVSNTAWSAIDGNFQAAATTSSGGVTVLCTESTPYSVGLNNGNNYNVTNSTRQMSDGASHVIAYGLYHDNALSLPWGDIGSGKELMATGSGSSQAATVYAQIPAGQTPVPAANFSDVVVVTLNF